MKKIIAALVFTAALPLTTQAQAPATAPDKPAAMAKFEMVFSPDDAISPKVVQELNSARSSIHIVMHDFTSKPVAEALYALLKAKKDVEVVVNKKNNQSGYSGAQFLVNMSTPVHQTKAEDTLQEDYIVIDENEIILGNFAGIKDEVEEKKSNAFILIIHNAPGLSHKFLNNWQVIWDASEEMQRSK